MPLTREQTKYQSTNDTVFFPTVAIDRNLAVRGTSVFDGISTFNNNLTVNGNTTFNGQTTISLARGPLNIDYTAADPWSSGFFVRKRGNSGDAFGSISNGSEIGYNSWFGWNGSTYGRAAYLIAIAEENFTVGKHGSRLSFHTTGLGASDATERMRLDSSGNVSINGTPVASNGRLTVNGGRTYLVANNDVFSLGLMYGAGLGQYYIGTTNSATPDLIFSNTTGGERVRITDAGSVEFKGTGTSSILFNTDSGGNLNLGRRDNNATSPYIDFNSGATTVDFDVRVQASGGTGTSGQGTLTISGNLIQNVNTTAKTGAYTLAFADANTLVQMNGAFAFTVPLNSTTAFPTGTTIHLLALTAGVSVTFTGGITSYATPGTKLRAAGSMATLIKLGTDTWVLSGDLTA